MIAALVADVHGNLPALEAVLADAKAGRADAVWNLGDFLGYGPFPDQVVRKLRAVGAVNILGNYDAKVLAFPRKAERWKKKKAPEKYLAFRWAYEQLSPQSREYLSSLPHIRRLHVEGVRVLLVHGSPEAIDEALGPGTSAERLAQLAQTADARLIACGHSHQPFVRSVRDVTFVNPGSVGRPEGGDWRACYALVHLGDGCVRAELRRVEYDVQATIEAIRAARLPDEFQYMLLEGKNLDQLRDG